MDLTPEVKQKIDSMTLKQLLIEWRFAPVGNELFSGESGEYFSNRMSTLRNENPEAFTQTSKDIGWGA